MNTSLSADGKFVNDEKLYQNFLVIFQNNFVWQTQQCKNLFKTKSQNLFDIFLNNLPVESEEEKQHFNCNACRSFVNKYCGLVTVDDNGIINPVFLNSSGMSEYYKTAIDEMYNYVRKSIVSGVFYTNKKEWGHHITDEWSHMAITPERKFVYRSLVKTPGQYSAEKLQDYLMLIAAIKKYPEDSIVEVIKVLTTNQLMRSEKFMTSASWFLGIHKVIGDMGKRETSNYLWKVVAEAPVGFCHISSSMLGTLLDGIKEGLSFSRIKESFNEKMDPTQYQRPQTPPSVGNIDQAEKIVADLGIEKSLLRKYAKADEVIGASFWVSTRCPDCNEKGREDGVFSKLRKNNVASVSKIDTPPISISWYKFAKTILPTAQEMKFIIPNSAPYCGILTCLHDDAPPIILWDSDSEERNPYSWYVYPHLTDSYLWGLAPNQSAKVKSICHKPSQWQSDKFTKIFGDGVILILDGCCDSRWFEVGSCLFPEILRSELNPVRKTINAFSEKTKIIGGDGDDLACGVLYQDDVKRAMTLAVKSLDNIENKYLIDRWD